MKEKIIPRKILPKRLTLVVNNTGALEGGTKATAVFDETGGSIGAGHDTTWVLKDRKGTVADHHIRVFFADGQYCLEAAGDSGLVVNDGAMPLRMGEPFQVSDGDTLRIGGLEIAAFVTTAVGEDDDKSHGERWAQRFVSVGTLVGDAAEYGLTGEDLLDANMRGRNGNVLLHDRLNQARGTDPVPLLEAKSRGRNPIDKDPLTAFGHEERQEMDGMPSNLGDYLDLELEQANHTELPDDRQPSSAYFAPQRVRQGQHAEPQGTTPQPGGANDMDSYLASLATRAPRDQSQAVHSMRDVAVRDTWLGQGLGEAEDVAEAEQLVDHVVLRPLCHALGLPIESLTVPQANQLAQDIGAALKAAITGIMEAHKRELSRRSHLAETHLHAIEDNPLRLEQTPQAAIRDLFLVQSPVHLSASSAIGESLTMLRYHQEANEAASEAALGAVLQALAPLALAKRFMKYKGHAPRSGDLDAWHWNMYQHYYAEVHSDHQGGLSRMFWEVFRQVYDREMRQRTQQG